MKLDAPSPGQAVDGGGAFTPMWDAFFTRVRDALVARSQFGTTAQRPTTKLEIGIPYFDVTLGKPIWVKTVSPRVWVDATGAAV